MKKKNGDRILFGTAFFIGCLDRGESFNSIVVLKQTSEGSLSWSIARQAPTSFAKVDEVKGCSFLVSVVSVFFERVRSPQTL